MRRLALILPLALASCAALPREEPPAARVVALVNGRPVTLDDLAPALLDAAGVPVLRERILGQMLTSRCTSAGITITPAMVDAERLALVQPAATGADAAQLRDLGNQLARDRGLSEVRLTELLRQNAMLRALVSPKVDIPEPAVLALYQVRHGPRMQASIVVVRSASEAGELAKRLRAFGPSDGEAAFAAAARSHSIDRSAPSGGVLPLISSADAGVPLALRNVLTSMSPGEISGPILLPNGYALARLATHVHASGVAFSDVRTDLLGELRSRLEREAMDQLAAELLGRAEVTPLDPALHRAWQLTQQR